MILLAGGGFLVERFLGLSGAFPIGVIAGLLVAPLVPAPVACGLRSRPKPGEDEDDATDERAA